jgi:hypothetical protein
MLGKLLKYDFKFMAKSTMFVYILTLLLAVVIKVIDLLKDKISILVFMQSLTILLFVIALFATFLYTFFVAVKYFYNNMLKDEGYLTHTLPVEKSKLLLSKGIVAVALHVISVLVIILALVIVFYKKGLLGDFSSFVNTLAPGVNKVLLWGVLIATMVLSYLQYLFGFVLALSWGHSKFSSKMVKSFVYGIVIYMVWQMASFILMGIIWLTVPSMSDMMTENTLNGNDMLLIYVYSIILQIFMVVGEYLLSVKILNNKLNLE